jgi:hypothetical protein
MELSRSDLADGRRPPYDPVLTPTVVLQTAYTLSDEQAKYQLKAPAVSFRGSPHELFKTAR